MGSTQKTIGNLEDEALKRRDKLKALKRKREGKTEGSDENTKDSSQVLPKPTFRSYKPSNEELKEFVMDPIAPGNVNAEVILWYVYISKKIVICLFSRLKINWNQQNLRW